MKAVRQYGVLTARYGLLGAMAICAQMAAVYGIGFLFSAVFHL